MEGSGGSPNANGPIPDSSPGVVWSNWPPEPSHFPAGEPSQAKRAGANETRVNRHTAPNGPFVGATVDSTISKDETANTKEKEEKLLQGLSALGGLRPQHPGDGVLPQPGSFPPPPPATTGMETGHYYNGPGYPAPPPSGTNAEMGSPYPRPGVPPQAPPPLQGAALQDHSMQLMLLEQQNKKRLMMARQMQDNQQRAQLSSTRQLHDPNSARLHAPQVFHKGPGQQGTWTSQPVVRSHNGYDTASSSHQSDLKPRQRENKEETVDAGRSGVDELETFDFDAFLNSADATTPKYENNLLEPMDGPSAIVAPTKDCFPEHPSKTADGAQCVSQIRAPTTKSDVGPLVHGITLNDSIVSSSVLKRFGVRYCTHPDSPGTFTIDSRMDANKLRLLINHTVHQRLHRKGDNAPGESSLQDEPPKSPPGGDVTDESHSNDQDPKAERIESLTLEVANLRKQVTELSSGRSGLADGPSLWPVLHRVHCVRSSPPAVYLDKPVWVRDSDHEHLDARRRISDEEEWEDRQAETPFVVYLDYECKSHEHSDGRSRNSFRTPQSSESQPQNDDSKVVHFKEEVRILSDILRDALNNALSKDEDINSYRPYAFGHEGRLEAPYIFHFQFGERVKTLLRDFASDCRDECDLFLSYIGQQMKEEESEARKLFEKGLVTSHYMPYLFVPGEILFHNDAGLKTATKLHCAIVKDFSPTTRQVKPGKKTEAKIWSSWTFAAEGVAFDGTFFNTIGSEMIDCSRFETTEMRIQDLRIYPMRFASEEDREYLMRRGKFLFSCRNRRYVVGPAENDGSLSEIRYMIDAGTYNLIHRSIDFNLKGYSRGAVIDVDESHADKSSFILRLPATAKGFHMQEKKWHNVPVDALKPIEWNEEVFKNLAVDDETKELVEALVTNKIEADKGTDLVAGKGTGLIMLLHGGPGTGKTLTAEGVAEIARKPLYRVTCGDVGTEPKAVEAYLESVFQLGRIWDCVVLLDEAEVFLEERSTLSLQRNALVSVFLRVLEYYDGILLLTTNRVGTFDEAFRSRIQIALHYEALTETQRRQIWKNFIQRLEDLHEDMDFDAIRARIPDLARWDMNGRQIRNAITTARQLAKFQKRRVTPDHFTRVMRVCKKFDDYLTDVKVARDVENERLPEEAMARVYGLR